MIKQSNVTIMVTSMQASISFYQSLGFILKEQWGDKYAQLEAPGILIGLHPSKENSSVGSGNISIGFTTDNLEKTQETLNVLSLKTQFRNEEGGQFIHFADPDGTMLYFIQPKW